MQNHNAPIKIRFATYNIRNKMDRYEERKGILRQTIQNVKSDIMGLQEVSFGDGGQLDELIQDENKNPLYQQYNSKMQVSWQETLSGPISQECRLDGNSMIVSNSFLKQNKIIGELMTLHLNLVRVAQCLPIKLENQTVVYFVNTHLNHQLDHQTVRLDQTSQILMWLRIKIPNYSQQNIIFCGDFNADPSEPCYKYLMDQGFKSAYLETNGREPEITFPTGLKAPNMDKDPPNCLDYIWFKGPNIGAQQSVLFGNQCMENDRTIFPSDHMGICTEFSIF